MKCKKCQKDAIAFLRYANIKLCEEHFAEFYEKRVKKFCESRKLVNPGEKLLVAISGGKDSTACLHALARIFPGKNELVGFYINLGIGYEGYSDEGQRICEENCKKIGIDFHPFNLKKEYGFGVEDIRLKRRICSDCGRIKRYVTNKVAYDLGCDKAVLGHNLDDEIAFLLINMAAGSLLQMERTGPATETNRSLKLVGRIKPLYLCTEKDDMLYCESIGAKYYHSYCPYGQNITQHVFKQAMNHIEDSSACTKIRLMNSFLEKIKPLIPKQEVVVKACTRCGMPTTLDVCSFCKLVERQQGKTAENRE